MEKFTSIKDRAVRPSISSWVPRVTSAEATTELGDMTESTTSSTLLTTRK